MPFNQSRRKPFFPFSFVLAVSLILCALIGCGKRETRVAAGIRDGVLHKGNGSEPQDIDPQTATGDIEFSVIMATSEGLIAYAPDDLHPVPGVAERWDVSTDGTVYTFYLRTNALWSNGDPVTAKDFVDSFERMLSPELGAEYVNMLFPMKNAEAYYNKEIKDFSQVGVKALDDHTLQIMLRGPIPYFISLLAHHSWYPVHLPTIRKHGGVADRSNRWTLPENFVGNGPFVVKEWKVNGYLLVERNPRYWDAANVKLNQIYFYPTENILAEERAFQAGMLHITKDVPQTKIPVYQKNHPDLIHAEPILSTYFYRINVTKPPFNDKRVRQALAAALDRDLLVKQVARGGQVPAFNLTPPGIAGYVPKAKLSDDLAYARKLLADAGYPDGNRFPEVTILFNTHEGHRAVAEAIQQMWRKNLNIKVALRNEEWKVYLNTCDKLDYQIARAGWGGDYIDPNTFLELFTTSSGNNQTGWSNKEYDDLILQASLTGDMAKRLELFQKAEAILVDEMPIIPLYFYTRPTLMHPSVREFYPTVLDLHPWKSVYLDPTVK